MNISILTKKSILTLTMAFAFLVVHAQPKITDFNPKVGPVGTSVTITGTGFNATAVNNIVYFGATKATVSSATTTSLTVVVPAGATFKPISVTSAVTFRTGYSSSPFRLTFAGGAGAGTFTSTSFTAYKDIHPTGTYVGGKSVAVADFDGDGKTDIAVARNISSTVSVFRNITAANGIAFSNNIDFNAGGGYGRIAVADFNGDGKQDIAVTDVNTNSVSVLTNSSTGAGTILFETRLDYATGSMPEGVEAGDIDGDGKTDMVVVNYASNTISVFRNNSTNTAISFAAKVDYPTGTNPYFLALADLNADGKIDIVTPNYYSGDISVLRNTSVSGTVSFAAKVDYPQAFGVWGIGIGDVDGDGKQDVVTSNSSTNQVVVFRNTSTTTTAISLAASQAIGSQSSAAQLALQDLDGDGKLDIGTASISTSEQDIRLTRNTSTSGTIANGGIYDVRFCLSPTPPCGEAQGVAFGDFDNDGKTDIVTSLANFTSYVRNTISEPSISSFTPTSAATGNTVTINGTNFTGATAVKFGNVNATSFTVNSASSISAVVGSGATGDVAVTTPNGTATRSGFNHALLPTITSFTPTSAGPNMDVVITGTNFSGITAVQFGGTNSTNVTVNSSTQITARVGGGATGNVTVTNAAGTASMAGFTFYPAPNISSFAPTSAITGTSITITGTGFTGATAVRFGSTFATAAPATSFTVNSSTQITAIVPSNAVSGAVWVETPGGNFGRSGFTFTPQPIISSFNPTSATTSGIVQIIGDNFTGATAVSFGGTAAASFTVNSATSITAVVGSGTSGAVSVTTAGGTATQPGFIFVLKPEISSFSPQNGTVGSNVTISGSNFSSTPSNNNVFFGAVKANVTAATSTSLTVTVPKGVTYHPISVSVNGLTVKTNKPFSVTFSGADTLTTASFPTWQSYTSGSGARAPHLFDLNEDGRGEVSFLINSNPGSLNIYRSASGQFGIPAYTIPTGGNPTDMVVEDFNGDGKRDVAVSYYTSGFAIFKNESTTTSISLTGPTNFSSSGSSVTAISAADFDNDGKQDIVITPYFGPVRVLRNTSTPSTFAFASPLSLTSGAALNDVAVADVDGDGFQDIIVVDNNMVSVYRNTTSGGVISFASKIDVAATGVSKISVGDIDGDGKIDIAMATGILSILRNTSTTGAVSFAAKVDITTVSGYMIDIGDVSGDGLPDAFLGGNGNINNIARNRSTLGVIKFDAVVAINAAVTGVTIGDVDDNEKLDVVYINNSNVTLLRNNSTQPIISSMAPTTAGPGQSVTLTGTNFSSVTQIQFGSTPATSFTIVNPTTITAVVPNLGNSTLTTSIVATAPGGSGSIQNFNYVPAPSITSFSPTTVGTGNTIQITGTFFNGATSVTLGGTAAASFTVVSNTQINAVVGSGSSGDVIVTTPYGSSAKSGLTYVPPPTIANFSPQIGVAGSVITITGTNLSAVTSVSIGGVGAQFTIVNSTTITATVNTNASSGNVVVTSVGGTATATGYLHTAISSFSPTQAGTGATVTINGTNLNGATAVSFGGVAATSFTQVSATQITAVVANGASGSVSVTTPAGTTTRTGFTYIPPPTITSFTPVAAPTGTTVTIIGTNFNWSPVTVRFGGTQASSVTVVNSTTINAVVGSGATGDVTVTTPGGTATLAGFTFLKPLMLSTTTQSFCPNINTTYPATIDVPVTVKNFTDVVSLQGSIGWDNSIMQLNGITDFGPANLSLTASNFNQPIPGKLVYVWHDQDVAGETLADNTVLFVMRFNIPNLYSSATSSPVQFLDNPVVMEATHKTVNPIPVTVTHGAVNLPAAASISALRPVTFCNGDSTILTTSYGGTKQWYKDNVAIVGATGNNYTVKTAGVFKVVAAVGACQFLSNSITTFVKAVPPAPTASSNSPINLGDTLKLFASLIPNAQYTWTTPSVQTYYGQNVQILNATTALTGTYSVTATVDGCTSTPATTNVVVNNIVFIKGRILYPNVNRDSVPYVTVKLSGTSNQTITTGVDGKYSFQVTPNGNYTITPSKNNDITKANGVSVLDVAVIQSHILLKDYLNSPFKYVAADANSSGTITAVDLVHIKRLILGIDGTFPGNKLWNFVDSSNPFITTNPITYNSTRTFNSLPWSVVNQNFYGIKIGDVTWNWNYTIFRRQGEKISLYHDTAYADAKDSIIIPIKVSAFTDVMALQYTLSWNYRKMDFVGIRKNTLGLEFGTQDAYKGNLSALWVDAGINNKSLSDGTVLFELVLKKKKGVVLDVETLDINSNIANIEAYDKDYAPIGLQKGNSVILEKKGGAGVQGTSSFTVTPNPSNGNIRVTLISASTKKVEIVLSDVSGKVLSRRSEGVFQGENIIDLNLKRNTFLAAGTYFLSIKGLEKTITQQIVITD